MESTFTLAEIPSLENTRVYVYLCVRVLVYVAHAKERRKGWRHPVRLLRDRHFLLFLQPRFLNLVHERAVSALVLS